MFEFHGWFGLQEAAHFVDEGSRWDEIIEGIKARVAALNWGTGEYNLVAEVRLMNGEAFLHLTGNKNHRGVIGQELADLLTYVAREAPGSYGLLYWRDDEGKPPAGRWNFQVTVMARGALSTRFDPFLSPTFPVLEVSDEGDESGQWDELFILPTSR
ncbi:Imm7 family immunity protein [Deinococcus sonorensis]|uniref:Imm7 family immunity protein n=2 Tax=Deinococcus sonorensis TaxID=309891 RepID=A0AAU7UGM6_9DEIO